jgi:small subunit ribosomal protein S9
MQDEREDAPEPEAPEGAAEESPEAAAEEAPEAAVEETPEAAAEETPEAAAEEAPEAAAEETSEAAAEEAPAEEAEEAPEAAADDAEQQRESRRDRKQEAKPKEEVIPGAHLEPDIVFEDKQPAKADEFAEYAQYVEPDTEDAADEEPAAEEAEPEPVALTPRELAADARYLATGKRKSAIARVILKPGEGTYSVNGRHLDEYFPRVRLQRMAHQPLEAAGYQTRMDVIARIHGGGIAAQATALRHGIARALVEADPNLRGELKRRGYLTRDPRVKERKKAGLKKARKRPQFSKR